MQAHFFRTAVLSLLISTAALAPSSAFAAATSQAEADSLRAFIEQTIEKSAGTMQLQGNTLDRVGEVKVEPKGNYYAVSTPSLTLSQWEGKVKIGVINLNMVPDPTAPHRWKAAVALPTPITITDTKGKDVTRVNIGAQRFNMVVDEALGFPLVLDATLDDVVTTDLNSQTTMGIKQMSAKVNYTEEQPGIWSGPTDVSLKDITFQARGADVKTPGTITLRELSFHGQVDKLDAALSDQYRAKMAELGNAGFSPEKMKTPQSVDAFWNIVMSYGLKQAENMTGQLRLHDLAFTPDAPLQGPKKQDTGPFKIAEMGYDFDFKNLRQEKSNLRVGGFIEGLQLSDTSADTLPYIPKDIRLSINAQDLPLAKVLDLLGDTASNGVAVQNNLGNPQAKKNIEQSLKDMSQALGQAGTLFTVENSRIAGTNYDLDVKGQFKMDPQAVTGGTGNAHIVFTGLDTLTKDLQAYSQKPDISPFVAQKITSMLPPLVMLQMMGQMGTGADGKPARIYDLELDAQGMTKLNGADMSVLQGMGGKGATPAPAAPTTKQKVSPEL